MIFSGLRPGRPGGPETATREAMGLHSAPYPTKPTDPGTAPALVSMRFRRDRRFLSLLWEQEVARSNRVAPTTETPENAKFSGVSAFDEKVSGSNGEAIQRFSLPIASAA